MSNPSNFGAICYEAESSWGEDSTSFATHRIPIRAAVDASGLTWGSVAPDLVQQYRQGGVPHIKSVMGGSFKTKLDWHGHGSTMVGSPSVDAIETFLGIVFGNVALSLATSQTMTGGTAAVPTMSGATGYSAGSLARLGALGDGDGDGQFYAVGTHSGSNLTLLGALNGAPVNGAVAYPVTMIYPSSTTTSTSITGTRFLLQTANLEYECHGCYPTAVSITGLNPGERPQIEITWGVSWWRYSTATFPSAVTMNNYNFAPIAAGSLNVQLVGTTTRNVRTTARSLSVNYTMNVTPIPGYGGVNAYQNIVGATRTGDSISIEWTEDADAATTTPVVPGYWNTATSTGAVGYYLVWTGSTTDGSAIGFKCPYFCPSNDKPQQFNDGGINRIKITGMAYTGGTTTSALTLAAIVLGCA